MKGFFFFFVHTTLWQLKFGKKLWFALPRMSTLGRITMSRKSSKSENEMHLFLMMPWTPQPFSLCFGYDECTEQRHTGVSCWNWTSQVKRSFHPVIRLVTNQLFATVARLQTDKICRCSENANLLEHLQSSLTIKALIRICKSSSFSSKCIFSAARSAATLLCHKYHLVSS